MSVVLVYFINNIKNKNMKHISLSLPIRVGFVLTFSCLAFSFILLTGSGVKNVEAQAAVTATFTIIGVDISTGTGSSEVTVNRSTSIESVSGVGAGGYTFTSEGSGSATFNITLDGSSNTVVTATIPNGGGIRLSRVDNDRYTSTITNPSANAPDVSAGDFMHAHADGDITASWTVTYEGVKPGINLTDSSGTESIACYASNTASTVLGAVLGGGDPAHASVVECTGSDLAELGTGPATAPRNRYVHVFPSAGSISCPSGWATSTFGSGGTLTGTKASPQVDSNGCSRQSNTETTITQEFTITTNTAPSISFNTPAGPAQSKAYVVTITDSDAGDTISAASKIDSSCNATSSDTTRPSGYSTLSLNGSGNATITISDDSQNGQSICIWARDGTDTSIATQTISGVDSTAPSVTTQPTLVGDASDGYINISESTNTGNIINFPTSSYGDSVSSDANLVLEYALVPNGGSCTSASYTSTVPTARTRSTDGSFQVCVSITDQAGNTGYGKSPAIQRDTTAPTISVNTALAGPVVDGYLNLADSNNSTDAIFTVPTTNDNTNNTILFNVINGTSSCANNSGGSAAPVTGDDLNISSIGQGEKKVCTNVSDEAGNTTNIGDGGSEIKFIVDTIAPSAPTGLDLAEADDSCATHPTSNTCFSVDTNPKQDNVTNQTTALTISGTAEANSTVNVFVEGASSFTATATGGNFSSDLTQTFSTDGDFDVTATATDAAGNTSATSSALTLTIDTAAPSNGTGDLTTDTCAQVIGNTSSDCEYGSKTDDKTNDDTPSFSFSGIEQRGLVFVTNTFSGTTADLTTSRLSGSSTTHSFTVPNGSSFSDGSNSIVTRVYDLAGNVSGTTTLPITIDTVAPAAPQAPDLDAASDTCAEYNSATSGCEFGTDSDNITSSSDPNFTITQTGPTDSDSTYVSLRNSSTVLDHQDVSGAEGNTFTTNSTPNNAAVSYNARAYDEAGNESSSSSILAVRYDKQISTPAINLNSGSDSGFSTTDNITNIQELTFLLNGYESGLTIPGTNSTVDPGQTRSRILVYRWNPSDVRTDATWWTETDNNNVLNDGEALDSTEFEALASGGVLYLEQNPNGGNTDNDSEYTTPALPEGVYWYLLRGFDRAGNTRWNITSTAGFSGTQRPVIVDLTAPEAPAKLDLNSGDDSYGLYQNISRDGTDADDITNDILHRYLSISSDRQAGELETLLNTAETGVALSPLKRERHQLRIYIDDDNDLVSDTVGDTTNRLLASGDSPTTITSQTNIVDVSNTLAGYPAGTSRVGRQLSVTINHNAHSSIGKILNNTEAGDDSLGQEADRYFAATQFDLAGNESELSEALKVLIDRQDPEKIRGGDVILHPFSDSGSSQTDGRTARTALFYATRSYSPSVDVDYYGLYRALKTGDTVGTYSYASPNIEKVDNSDAPQGSYSYPDTDSSPQELSSDVEPAKIPEGTGFTQISGNYGCEPTAPLLVQFNGALTCEGLIIEASELTTTVFNRSYDYRVAAFDLAGNGGGLGSSSEDVDSILHLIPPPAPEQLNLLQESDTCSNLDSDSACEVGANDDDITNLTSIKLATRYGNGLTTGTNTNLRDQERTNNAAGAVTSLIITITPPAGADSSVEVVIDLDSVGRANGAANVNSAYDLRAILAAASRTDLDLNLEEIFGDNLVDGEYVFQVQTGNAFGDRSAIGSTDPVSITLDRGIPAPQDDVRLTINDYERAPSGVGRFVEVRVDVDDTDGVNDGDSVYLEYTNNSGNSSTNISEESDSTGERAFVNVAQDYDLEEIFVTFADKAGNITDRFAVTDLPINPLPPIVRSYRLGASSDQYVVISTSRDGELLSVSEHAQNGSGNGSFCYLYSTSTRADLGVAPVVFGASSEFCATTSSTVSGITTNTVVNPRKISTVLVDNLAFVDGSDTGFSSTDFITKNTSPRFTLNTISGATARLEYKLSTAGAFDAVDTVTTTLPLSESRTEKSLFSGQFSRLAPGVYNTRVAVDFDIDGTPGIAVDGSETFMVDTYDVTIDTEAPTTLTAIGARTDLGGSRFSTRNADNIGTYNGQTALYTSQSVTDIGSNSAAAFNGTGAVDATEAVGEVDGYVEVEYAGITYRSTQTGSTGSWVIEDITLEEEPTRLTAYEYDLAGNQGTAISFFVVKDTEAPTVVLIKTSGGDGTTSRTIVSNAFDNREIRIIQVAANQSICDSNTSGFSEVTDTSVTVAANTESCFQVRDRAGNAVYALSDTAVDGIGGLKFSDGRGNESGDGDVDGTTYYARNGQLLTGSTGIGFGYRFYYAATGTTVITDVNDPAYLTDIQLLAQGQNRGDTTEFSIPLSGLPVDGTYDFYRTINQDPVADATAYSIPIQLGTLVVDNVAPTTLAGTAITTQTGNPVVSNNLVLANEYNGRATVNADAVYFFEDNNGATNIWGPSGFNRSQSSLTEANSKVQIVKNGEVIALQSADGTGYWDTAASPNILDEGENSYTFTEIDRAGNRGPSFTIVVVKDSTAPVITAVPSRALIGLNTSVNVVINISDAGTDKVDLRAGGAQISETNPVTLSLGGQVGDFSAFPATFAFTSPSSFRSGSVSIGVPAITDFVGLSSTLNTPVVVIDANAPRLNANGIAYSVSGSSLSVSAKVDRNNHASRTGNEAVRFAFVQNPDSSVACGLVGDTTATVIAASDSGELVTTATASVSTGTYPAGSCMLVVRDDLGNQSNKVAIDVDLVATVSSGRRSSGGGGGGSFNVQRFESDKITISPAVLDASEVLKEVTTSKLTGAPQEVSTTPDFANRGSYSEGSNGAYVRDLQKFLNSRGHTIATTGPGSAGNETTYFGPATTRAVIAFQASQGLAAVGIVGPQTQAAIAQLLSGTVRTLSPADKAKLDKLKQLMASLQEKVKSLRAGIVAELNTLGVEVPTTSTPTPVVVKQDNTKVNEQKQVEAAAKAAQLKAQLEAKVAELKKAQSSKVEDKAEELANLKAQLESKVKTLRAGIVAELDSLGVTEEPVVIQENTKRAEAAAKAAQLKAQLEAKVAELKAKQAQVPAPTTSSSDRTAEITEQLKILKAQLEAKLNQ